MTNDQESPEAAYVVPQDHEEAERLALQSRLLEEPTRYVLGRIGLAPGMDVLDVGCGAGDVLGIMAERVTASGSVTGIDLNGELGRAAITRLARPGAARLHFIEGDFLRAEMPASGPFDVVFSRLVFQHLRQLQSTACEKLWRWIKPGGHLVVMEHDYRMIQSEPGTPVMESFRRIIHDVFDRAGVDSRCGGKLPAVFEKAGLGSPDGVHVATPFPALNQAAPLLRLSYRSFYRVATQLGIVDLDPPSRFEGLLDAMANASEIRIFFPMIVTAWKRKAA